jgi:hypothetical protein
MELYLRAAFEAEESKTPKHDPPLENWVEVIKQAHRACKQALDAVKEYRKEHGC